MKIKFSGNILVIGCGYVSRCTLPLLLRHIDVPPKNIIVMDFNDYRSNIKRVLDTGVKYVEEKITQDNMEKVLSKFVGKGDMVIDLAWNIDCCQILQWCHDHNVLYINTSVEVWDPYENAEAKSPTERTLYVRHMAIRKMVDEWSEKNMSTAVLEHGANPGLVSHFVKMGLVDISRKLVKQKPKDKRIKEIKKAIKKKEYNKLAMLLKIKVIHISERDSQITNRPKEVNEFVNTWSVEGLREEGIAPAEIGWGTHEKILPSGAFSHQSGPGNQICLSRMGIKTWVRSWVPSGEITGMVVRHGEAFTISDYLTVWDGEIPTYRPTVHYAYCPSDSTVNSLHELEMRRYKLQEKERVLTDEIVGGQDELGVLMMGHDFKSWWVGSILGIDESRELVPHQNATTLQVACSVIAAVIWAIKNPKKGVCTPDDLPLDEILEIAKPYLGQLVSRPVNWDPIASRVEFYDNYNNLKLDTKDPWQFQNFLVR